MSHPTRRSLLGGLSSAAMLVSTQVNAAWWLRVSKGVQTIALTIPAIFSSAVNPASEALFNGPLPAFSLGPNGSQVLLDQSLIAQGGTGVLTDDMKDAGLTPGDASGFGVVNGELMLVDDTQFYYRTSGPIRNMRWVQTLGGQTLTQTISLLLDPSVGRVWDQTYPAAQRGSTNAATWAYHNINYLQWNFPLTTGLYVPSTGWPGLSYPTGCPDDYRLGRNGKKLIKAITGTYPNITLNPDFVSKYGKWFKLNQQGSGHQIKVAGDASNASTYTTVQTLAPSASDLAGTPGFVLIDGVDFSGCVLSIAQSYYHFTNCYMDASCWQAYQQAPGVNFLIRNARLGDNGDTALDHLYIDNMADLLAFHTAAVAVGLGVYGRSMCPIGPGTQLDSTFNPFVSSPYIKDIVQNGSQSYILLGSPVPTNNGFNGSLPAGLSLFLGGAAANDARNPNGSGFPGGGDLSASGQWRIEDGVISGMELCTVDGRVPGYLYGMIGCTHVPLSSYGSFGPAADENGTFRGMGRCAIIGSPQDICDIATGCMYFNSWIAGSFCDGSHVDGWQGFGPVNLGYKGAAPATAIVGNFIDNRKRYVGPEAFPDGSANPYFALYGASKMPIGGQNSVIYDEIGEISNGANPNYGNVTIQNNLLRGAAYGIYITSDNRPGCYFTKSSPAAVVLTAGNTPSSPTNLVRYPGYITSANGGAGENIAFNAGFNLPPAITPYKIYQIAGYCCGDATIGANSTTGFAPNDTLQGTDGTLAATGGAAATWMVDTVDGSGKVLTMHIVNPGSYASPGTKPKTLGALSSAAGAGAITIALTTTIKNIGGSNAPGTSTNNAFLLRDPATGLLVDTSGSSTGTGPVTFNSFRGIIRGMHLISGNRISDQTQLTATRMAYSASPNYGPSDPIQKDAAGNLRPIVDNIAIFGNYWLYGLTAGFPDVRSDPFAGISASAYSLLCIHNFGDNAPSVNPPPVAVTALAAASVSSTQLAVTFPPDANARVSMDAGVTNPSGYQYMIRQTGGTWPAAWSTLPAVATSGSNVTTTLPDALTKGQSYDVMVRGVNCYQSPEMVPAQFAANSNVATIVMPAA